MLHKFKYEINYKHLSFCYYFAKLLNELEPISSFKILGFFETFKIIRNKSDHVIDINYRDVEVVYKISY